MLLLMSREREGDSIEEWGEESGTRTECEEYVRCCCYVGPFWGILRELIILSNRDKP